MTTEKATHPQEPKLPTYSVQPIPPQFARMAKDARDAVIVAQGILEFVGKHISDAVKCGPNDRIDLDNGVVIRAVQEEV